MAMLRRLVGACLAVFLGLSLAACDSLPKNLEQQAETLEKNINGLDTLVQTRETEYAQARKAPTWSFYAPYAQRENWQREFVEARSEIATLRATYEREVNPILERDESKDAEALRTTLTRVTGNYTNTTRQVNFVRDRMSLLANARRQAPAWRTQVATSATAIDRLVTDIQPVISKAKADFPNRSADIDRRFIPLRGLQESTARARQIVETQFAKHASNSSPDYAAFADAYTLTQRNTQAATAENTRYRAALASLSREYSLILRDMRMEYWVKPQQETWCDYVDCFENTNEFAFVPVSKAVFDSIENAEEISDETVRSFGLNPSNDQDMSRGGRTWYIADSEIRYFHKYAEVNGKTVTERNWEAVDEEDFGQHANDFGMAIRTKKLGQFEDEVVDEATPPGMDMVGDPRYGNWVSDGNGGQRWSFLEMYAVYALLTGGNNSFYNRNDYDSYRRWRDERERNGGVYGWYGANRGAPIYGSTGSRTRATAEYRNSPFSRVGGVSAVPNDVRQAGSSARSRGPGSRGK